MSSQDDLIGKMFNKLTPHMTPDGQKVYTKSVSNPPEGWEKELRYQIMDAIAYVGINPKTSGGWTDEVKRPIVEDIIVRIKEKVLPTLLTKKEKELVEVTGETSDGYHTFNELYDHRIRLYIALCSTLHDFHVETDKGFGDVWKSKFHSDGKAHDGWFILGIFREKGKQITYHLPIDYWDELDWAVTLDKAPEWDGHTPEDVVKRLKELK